MTYLRFMMYNIVIIANIYLRFNGKYLGFNKQIIHKKNTYLFV